MYQNLCYSDIGILYGARGLLEGNTPYLDAGNYPVLEYPVLTGAFLELERLITVALGAPTGPGLSDQQTGRRHADLRRRQHGAARRLPVDRGLGSAPVRPAPAVGRDDDRRFPLRRGGGA